MNKFLIDERFKGIGDGKSAFCIFGGPSAKEVDNLDWLIDNNFSVTVNNNIVDYPNVDMYVTADNVIARTYFEQDEFYVHKFIGGKILRGVSNFEYDPEPIWIKPKKDVFSTNPDMLKVIGCNKFPCYNRNFTTGQVYYLDGVKFCKDHKNLYICIEHRNENGDNYPTLTLQDQNTFLNYGKNPKDFIGGGNVSSIVFQLLRYMGFSQIITVGYADIGQSNGYDKPTEFEWSPEEIHAMSVHSHIWGDGFRILKGGELFSEFQIPYNPISPSDMNNKEEKLSLIRMINNL